jgi:hypothetical protein
MRSVSWRSVGFGVGVICCIATTMLARTLSAQERIGTSFPAPSIADSQRAALKEISDTYRQRVGALLSKRRVKSPGSSGTLVEQIRAINEERAARIRAVLTTDQRSALDAAQLAAADSAERRRSAGRIR